MLAFLDPFRGLGFGTVVLKMTVSFLLGAAIGIERSYKNRPAGFRTHILVALGASVASMSGIYIYLNDALPADVSRIGAAVVSGLGFLGAGTIIVTKQYSVKGLTTAAGLWTSENNKLGVINLQVIGAPVMQEAEYLALISLRPRMKVDKEKLFRELAAIDGVSSLNEAELA